MSLENLLVGAKDPSGSKGNALRKSVFTFNNPTVGTGIALNADPTAIAETEASLIIDIPAASTASVTFLKSLKLTCTATGTAATKASLAFYKDSINRYSSGGSTLSGVSTSASSNTSNVGTAQSKVYFGDLIAAAASSAGEDHLFSQLIKSDTPAAPCFAVGDEFLFETMSVGKGDNNYYDSAGVCASQFKMPMMYLHPGSSLLVKALFPNQSAAASFEVEVVMYEV